MRSSQPLKLKRNSIRVKKGPKAALLLHSFLSDCHQSFLSASISNTADKDHSNFKQCGMINTHEMLSHLKFKEQQVEFKTLK